MKSQHTDSSLEELKQIQLLAKRSQSVNELREYFARVQSLRRTHLDDFDLQIFIAQVHEDIVERARALRNEGASPERDALTSVPATPGTTPLDQKTWRRATFIGLFFTFIILAAFFYLVQAARKSNLLVPQHPAATAARPQPHSSAMQSAGPILRLYTDLVPGTVSIDNAEPRNLKDGELVLDHLATGLHTILVAGHSGRAEFTYAVSENAAPAVIGTPSAANAMAVLVSTKDGKAHLVTNAGNVSVLLDGSAEGHASPGGLTISGLGNADHELELSEGKDRQRFILTYTAAPALTVYVKSDPNAGTLVLVTHQDNDEVFINGALYRRRTSHGQLRIPLKVGEYTIRVHKSGFIDPPTETVQVNKAEETALQFSMQPAPQFAMLAVRGALPGTMVYLDKYLAAVTGIDGSAAVSNIKPGVHDIVLRRGEAVPKQFTHTFHAGDSITLSGPAVLLAKAVAQEPREALPHALPPAESNTVAPNYNVEIKGEQVHRGGGFVPSKAPRRAGHYSFWAQARKTGGFLRHGKVRWYAGYTDASNYVLFVLDGKHAAVREVRGGESFEVARVAFLLRSKSWVQVHMNVQPGRIDAQVKTEGSGWVDMSGPSAAAGQDFSKGEVGFYIPGREELAVSDFRFSSR